MERTDSGGKNGERRKPQKNFYRGVAQLVARQLWELDAASSSPATPTKIPEKAADYESAAFCFIMIRIDGLHNAIMRNQNICKMRFIRHMNSSHFGIQFRFSLQNRLFLLRQYH